MIVRPAERRDIEAIRQIYNQAVLTTTATYDYEPKTLDQQNAWFEDEHEQIGFPVFVAQDGGGEVIGWSSLQPFRPRPGYRFTAEDSIYVDEQHRGQGAGKLLLAPVVEAATELGMRAILAVIDAESQASIRLHARFGFQEVARMPRIGFKFDRWLDCLYMELLLF